MRVHSLQGGHWNRGEYMIVQGRMRVRGHKQQ